MVGPKNITWNCQSTPVEAALHLPDLVIRMTGDEEDPLGPLELLEALVGLDPREDEVEEQAGQEDGQQQEGQLLHPPTSGTTVSGLGSHGHTACHTANSSSFSHRAPSSSILALPHSTRLTLKLVFTTNLWKS